jgi:hypothetical protein
LLDDSDQFAAALSHYETIYSFQSQSISPVSSETLIQLAQSITKICIRAIESGEDSHIFKKSCVAYAQASISLEQNTSSISSRRFMAAQVQLWRAYLACDKFTKALNVVNKVMIPHSKSVHGKFSLRFIACLVRRASTRVQIGDIETALSGIFRVSISLYNKLRYIQMLE